MDRKKILVIAVVSMVLASFAVTAVAASSKTSSSPTVNVPLYTVRMEQASSEMNFLPTEKHNFAYNTEKGCTLNYCVADNCNSAVPLHTSSQNTCYGYVTCEGSATCWQTCYGYTHGGYTCFATCYNWWTCTPATCHYSCGAYTCVAVFTCMGTCVQTCPETCETCQGQGWIL